MKGKTKLEIYNMALMKVGEQTIQSLDENSESRRVCDVFYDQTKSEVLREYPWNGASDRATLVQTLVVPAFGYEYSYQLPADFVRLIQIYEADGTYNPNIFWEIEGDFLLTDNGDIGIQYVKEIADTLKLDSLCIGAIVCKLAMNIAFSRTSSRHLTSMLREEYETFILPRARSIDTYENRKEIESELDPWLSSRSGSLN